MQRDNECVKQLATVLYFANVITTKVYKQMNADAAIVINHRKLLHWNKNKQ